MYERDKGTIVKGGLHYIPTEPIEYKIASIKRYIYKYKNQNKYRR